MLVSSEIAIRVASYLGVLVLMMVAETLVPRRALCLPRRLRWPSNLGLVLLNSVLVRFVFPIGAVGTAIAAENSVVGVLRYFTMPQWFSVLLSFFALDLAIYLQHVLFHAVPALWRLHMVHHADLEFDCTTGSRFHTFEIMLSMFIKAGVVILLGAPPLGVLLFEVALNATAVFNHSNVQLPVALDRILRLLVVTPDMHRVHHSVLVSETNSNFGFNFPWWDRILGTYRSQPTEGHTRMVIGLAHFRERHVQFLPWMLSMPFRASPGDYPFNRRRNS